MSPVTRAALNVLAGTLMPVLAVTAELNTTNVLDVPFWLGVLVTGITALSASLSTQLASLVKIANAEAPVGQ
jgi:hypothetical protein